MHNVAVCNLTVLAIAMIYYTWRDYRYRTVEKRRKLSLGVTRMLFSAAQRSR